MLAYSSAIVVFELGTYCEGLVVESSTDCEESIVEAIRMLENLEFMNLGIEKQSGIEKQRVN